MSDLWTAVTVTAIPPHIYRVRIQKTFSRRQVVYDVKF